MEENNDMASLTPDGGSACGPECGPDCKECGPDKASPQEEPSAPTDKLVQAADTLVVMMFVVGVASQVFSFLIYAFATPA